MKKFYALLTATLLCFLTSFISISIEAQNLYTGGTFQTVPGGGPAGGDLGVAATWLGTPPDFHTPCSNCRIILNGGTLHQTLFDITVKDSSLIEVMTGTAINIDTYTILDTKSQVLVHKGARVNVNDELDLAGLSFIHLADITDTVNAQPLFTSGPRAALVGGGGIFAIKPRPTSLFDVTLSSIGQSDSAGTVSFDPYMINCVRPFVPGMNFCQSGFVFGPAFTQNNLIGPGPTDSLYSFGQGVTLPVTLVRWTAELNSDQTVGLIWTTAQETNSDYFEVQRSTDGATWTKLGQVQAKGFSSIATNYGYTDPTPIKGVGYYRLKMVDVGGTFQFSKTISIRLNEAPQQLVIYSNPFFDDIRLKINTSIPDHLYILVTDIQGQIILRQNLNTQIGDNQVILHPGTGAAQGPYILRIQGNTINQTVKLIKQQ